MKPGVQKALIAAGSSILAALISIPTAATISVKNYQTNNNSMTINLNGEKVVVTAEKYEELIRENESLKAQLRETTPIVDGGSGIDSGSNNEDKAIGKEDIFSFLPFKENGGDFLHSANGYKDNLGNTYPDGYLIMYNHMVNRDKEICYVLDQKYSTLSGTIALNYSNKDIKEGLWIEFYSNDKMIWKTQSLSSGVKPVEFSVDVSQVSELTIRINGGGYSGGILTQGFYLE